MYVCGENTKAHLDIVKTKFKVAVTSEKKEGRFRDNVKFNF